MKKLSCIIVMSLLLAVTAVQAQAGKGSTLGVGATYWTSIDDIDVDNIEDDGFTFLASYQFWPSLIGFEVDLEVDPDKYGETAVSPEFFVVVGGTVYGAAGVGWQYWDSEFADEPFFALRAGLNLELLPGIFCDIYGTYRFSDKEDLDNDRKDIDTDTIYLGAMLRFSI